MLSTLTRANRVLAEFLVSSTTRRIAAAIAGAVPTGFFGQSSTKSSRGASRGSFFEPLENRAMMSATYYVSPSGSDSNSGTISFPWKSIGKVNSTHLSSGDEVLFQGGQTFSGSLRLFSEGGTVSNPAVIGSYGSGRATLSSGGSNGIWLLSSAGFEIQNLIVRGTPSSTSSQDGIRIENDSRGATKSGITVNNCDISGYAESGIDLLADGAGMYLNDVSITNSNIYNNVGNGIESYSVGTWGITNLTITNDQVHDTYGAGSTLACTGSGIMLGGVNGAMVSNDSAYNNGERAGNGGVGIWAYSSNNVTFQYDQSYNNVSMGKMDGDGFDFDADTSNSVMQYNLAYGNSGGAFLLDQWHNDSLSTNDTVRFNVAQGNCKKFNYGEIESWGKMLNSDVYNNVIYAEANSSKSNTAIRVHDSSLSGLYSSNVHFANNIIETTGGIPAIEIPSAEVSGMRNVTFVGNVYYANGSTLKIDYGNSGYSTLAQWQSTGQEKLNGSAVGLVANPLFKAPGSASSLYSISDYDLQSSTPILNVGVNLSSVLGIATPSSGSAKTIPGVDQSLAGGKAAGIVGAIIAASTPTTTATTTTTSTTSTNKSTGTTTTTASGSTTTSTASAGISFTSADIGAVSKAGSDAVSGSTYKITSGGTVIGSTSDKFHYAYTTLTGNGQIVANVSSFSTTASGLFAGVMIRNGTASNAAEVSVLLNPDKTEDYTSRSSTGASTEIGNRNDAGSQWVKLVRSGSTFAGYISADGTHWSLVGWETVSMSATVDIGLAVTSDSTSHTDTASFSNVAIT